LVQITFSGNVRRRAPMWGQRQMSEAFSAALSSRGSEAETTPLKRAFGHRNLNLVLSETQWN
jgi:hypothetical protein